MTNLKESGKRLVENLLSRKDWSGADIDKWAEDYIRSLEEYVKDTRGQALTDDERYGYNFSINKLLRFLRGEVS